MARTIMAALLLACALPASALLHNDYERLSLEEAIARAKADPSRHVLVYFGLETFCPPCNYTRNLLAGSGLRNLYRPAYATVAIDLRHPTAEQRKVIERFKVRWAPTLVFLDGSGKTVARLGKGFKNEKEAILVHEFVSQKLYARTGLDEYVKANFNQPGSSRVVPETRVARTTADEPPRLRDVLGQAHERIAGDPLKALLAGKRMEKENQDWFLTMRLAPGGKVAADGRRKDGAATMRGPGTWYVTKKGKLCVEVKAEGLDETWCRHVFRVGENYYYATKDLRPDRVAYRFTLEPG